MRSDIEGRREHAPLARRAVAGLVLIAAAALAIHIVIGLVLTIFWVVVAVTAVVAIIWALKTVA